MVAIWGKKHKHISESFQGIYEERDDWREDSKLTNPDFHDWFRTFKEDATQKYRNHFAVISIHGSYINCYHILVIYTRGRAHELY
jgi:hypothetical protein